MAAVTTSAVPIDLTTNPRRHRKDVAARWVFRIGAWTTFLVTILILLTLVVDACSYVVSALFLRSVEAEEPAPEAPGKGHVVAGVRWVFGNPIVRAALGATATINFFNFVFFALFILYATKSLDVPPGTLGLVLGAGAIGGVVGSIGTGRVARRIGVRQTNFIPAET